MRNRATRSPAAHLLIALLLAVSASLPIVTTAHAQGIVYGDRIPAGTTIENDVILFGDSVVIDGVVEGDVIAFGTSVEVNGSVAGALLAAGQTVRVTGSIGGSIYAASLVLGFGPAASVGRGVYFAGGQLDTAPGSIVGRDIRAIALGARLEGNLGRNMHAIIGPVELLRMAVQGVNALLGANRIELPPLLAPTSAVPSTVAGEVLSMGIGSSRLLPQAASIDTERLLAWLARFGLDLVTFAVLGLLVVWLAPSLLSRGSFRIRTSPLAALAWGVAVFASGIVVLILGTAIVVAVSIMFWALSLGALGSVTLLVGLFSILLAATCYVVIVLFYSKLVTGFFLGRWILTMLSPRLAEARVWPMLLGILIYLLLAAIPYLGWLTAVAATFIGLGAIWQSVQDSRQY